MDRRLKTYSPELSLATYSPELIATTVRWSWDALSQAEVSIPQPYHAASGMEVSRDMLSQAEMMADYVAAEVVSGHALPSGDFHST